MAWLKSAVIEDPPLTHSLPVVEGVLRQHQLESLTIGSTISYLGRITFSKDGDDHEFEVVFRLTVK